MKHWTEVLGQIDMSCYADFYQSHVLSALERTQLIHPIPKLAVELGVRHGCSARIIKAVLPMDYKFVLVDPASTEEMLEMLDGKTVFWESDYAERCVNKFENESISILHIDVDPHEYMQTKNIFELYIPKVCKKGLILFHDCNPNVGVYRFVMELLETKLWNITFADPKEESPISAPAAVIKLI